MGQIVPVDSYIYRHVIPSVRYICMQLAVLGSLYFTTNSCNFIKRKCFSTIHCKINFRDHLANTSCHD